MRLYLVQHGEAVPEDVDPARPLSERGHADVRRMAAFLGRAGVRPARIWHSGKRRAEQTAEILAQALAPARPPEARTGLNPKDPIEGIARELGGWDQDMMLVGHLPFMARLASRLVVGREGASVVGFQPGSALCLERADQQRWTIAWMLRPELLRLS
jgi:phosphohistidine phosphatase